MISGNILALEKDLTGNRPNYLIIMNAGEKRLEESRTRSQH